MEERRVFIASTKEDLEEHRDRAIADLRRAGWDVVAMEDWPADSAAPRVLSVESLQPCQLVLLLVAFHRGSLPPGETRSFVQIEYDAAKKANIPVLVFMLREKDAKGRRTRWSRDFDKLDEDVDEHGIRAWRATLKEKAVCEEFDHEARSLNVLAAINRWRDRQSPLPPTLPRGWRGRYLNERRARWRHVDAPITYGQQTRALLQDVFTWPSLRGDDAPSANEAPETMLLRRWLTVLTGDAGSGKTTLLQYLALRCATEQLDAEGDDEHGVVPVIVNLATLVEGPPPANDALAEDANARWIQLFRRELKLDELQWKRVAPKLRFVFLFDGFDEVRSADERDRLVDAIAHLHGALGLSAESCCIVACRPGAWSSGGACDAFERVAIEPMSPRKTLECLTNWSNVLRGSETSNVMQSLERALRSSPDLQQLASNPQLAALLAQLYGVGARTALEEAAHADDSPLQYAQLLGIFVGKARRLSRNRGEKYQVDNSMHVLQALARAMQVRPDAELNALPVDEAERIASDVGLGRLATEDERREQGATILANLVIATGLIEVRKPGQGGTGRGSVRFKHRTFQEYLTAQFYVEHDRTELLDNVTEASWSNVLTLTAGILTNYGEDAVSKLLEQIVGKPEQEPTQQQMVERAPRVAAAAACVAALAPYQLKESTLAPANKELNLILPVLETGSSAVELKTRVGIATGLGRIHDPRLRSHLRWVNIPDGVFARGSDAVEAWPEESPCTPVRLSAFLIQRWPVTVEEYSEFVKAGGYTATRWWAAEGIAWRQAEKIESPLDWPNQRAHKNFPVTGVSYWEARAYCRFSQEHGGVHTSGFQIDLPTEAQWEMAAGGPEFSRELAGAQRYPWGNRWLEHGANGAFARLGHVVPVGLFPAGHSRVFKLWDMAGNTADLCRDGYAPYEPSASIDPFCSDYRYGHVVRGGSFSSLPLDLRITRRSGQARHERDPRVGFRCVVNLQVETQSEGGL